MTQRDQRGASVVRGVKCGFILPDPVSPATHFAYFVIIKLSSFSIRNNVFSVYRNSVDIWSNINSTNRLAHNICLWLMQYNIVSLLVSVQWSGWMSNPHWISCVLLLDGMSCIMSGPTVLLLPLDQNRWRFATRSLLHCLLSPGSLYFY